MDFNDLLNTIQARWLEIREGRKQLLYGVQQMRSTLQEIREIQATMVIRDVPKPTEDVTTEEVPTEDVTTEQDRPHSQFQSTMENLAISVGKFVEHVEGEASCESQISETPVASQHLRCTRIHVKRSYHKTRKKRLVTTSPQQFHTSKAHWPSCKARARNPEKLVRAHLNKVKSGEGSTRLSRAGKQSRFLVFLLGSSKRPQGLLPRGIGEVLFLAVGVNAGQRLLSSSWANRVWEPGRLLASQVERKWLEEDYNRKLGKLIVCVGVRTEMQFHAKEICFWEYKIQELLLCHHGLKREKKKEASHYLFPAGSSCKILNQNLQIVWLLLQSIYRAMETDPEVLFAFSQNGQGLVVNVLNVVYVLHFCGIQICLIGSWNRQFCKTWWFKYKLNTWLSEAPHLWKKSNYEDKLQRSSKFRVSIAVITQAHSESRLAEFRRKAMISDAESTRPMDIEGRTHPHSLQNLEVKLTHLVIAETTTPTYPMLEYLILFSVQVGMEKQHSSSKENSSSLLRANQIWDPGGMLSTAEATVEVTKYVLN